jgi:hypothetical protein
VPITSKKRKKKGGGDDARFKAEKTPSGRMGRLIAKDSSCPHQLFTHTMIDGMPALHFVRGL